MARNIIFVILFVVLYGGLVLLGTQKNDDTLTDRKGYGTLTDEAYDCERFSMKMEFEPEWIVFDGVSVDAMANASLDRKSPSDSSISKSMDFIVGVATPEAILNCACIENNNLKKDAINESNFRSTIEFIRKNIEDKGGVFGSYDCRSISAQGSGNKIIIFYYDYEISGDRTSLFNCYTNSGEDPIMLFGTYENVDGLNMLTDFVENRLTIYSEYTTAL